MADNLEHVVSRLEATCGLPYSHTDKEDDSFETRLERVAKQLEGKLHASSPKKSYTRCRQTSETLEEEVKKDRSDIRSLNERFSAYIGNAKFLEDENKMLKAENEELKEQLKASGGKA